MNMTSEKKHSFCHAKLPNAGLGNKLFVWAKALVFARMNQLPLIVTGWTQFQLAPILRGNDWRLYWNYFQPVKEVNWFNQLSLRRRARIIAEPPVAPFETGQDSVVFEFSKLPHWSNFFGDLKPHREMIRSALMEMLTPARRRELERVARPAICVQVRMGDFRLLKKGEDFAKVGAVRTPLTYFADLIQGIRELHKTELPVQIISDGRPADLRELLNLPKVSMYSGKNTAIVDLLIMANSRILIPSAGSTFGYWAGFLGNNTLILHSDHIYKTIRPDSVNKDYYEGAAVGPAQQWPDLLKNNIRAI